MLWRALREVEHGCYIDVGAAEPEADSVTCAFYKRGWRGVNFEPAHDAFERLSAARPDDINLNIAIGDRSGLTPFYMVDGGNGLSTAMPDQMQSLRDQGWDSTKTHVPVLTLASVLAEYLNRTVHFLKVDAEGAERAVLAGADLQNFRPWIILVEATAPNSQVQTHLAWEDLLLDADYRFVWYDGLNRFYVASEKAELEISFQAQPNVFDDFVRYSEVEAKAQLSQARLSLSEASSREHALAADLAVLRAQSEGLIAETARLATSLTEAGHTRADELSVEVKRLGACLAEANLHTQQTDAARQSAEAELAVQISRANQFAVQAALIAAERDTWMQELFEASRHSAYLTQTKQALIESLAQYTAHKAWSQGIVEEVARLQSEVQCVEAEKMRFHDLVLTIYASTSWKLTRPMRAVARLLGRR